MMTNNNEKLSESARKTIAEWIKRYPNEHKRSGVFEALRIAQEENNGSLTPALMDDVAAFLEMPAIAVYEVATFYSMFHHHPVGRHVVELCTNVPCQLNGAEAIGDYLKQKLGISFGETTPDNRITLKEVECLGACVSAPVCQLGKAYIEKLTPEKIDEMLAKLT